MAELPKLNAIGKGSIKHQHDMEALQTGAMQGGSLTPHLYQEPTPVPVDNVPARAGETDEEAAVPAMQAANAKNPGTQEKLNMMAKARAKFYGEGI